MSKYKIAVIKGDGIGPEITNEALKVLKTVSDKLGFSIETTNCLMGGCAIDKFGIPLPEETINTCKESDAVLLGAVGGPKWDGLVGELRPEAGLLGIRKSLGLFCNLRPAKIFDSLKNQSPLKEERIENVDLVIVRELCSGIYFGERGRLSKNGINAAFDTEYYTAEEIRRIAIKGFDAARRRNKKLTSVDKANVLESSRFWREIIVDVSKDYPDVSLNHLYVDNCAMQLVSNPSQFDVIVTSNMFGDILSDEASQISGSIGMLASASLREDSFGLYEPIHGSAPDIANKNISNPLASILSIAMMLETSLDQQEGANLINTAVDEFLKTYRTVDIMEEGKKKVSTTQTGDILANIILNA